MIGLILILVLAAIVLAIMILSRLYGIELRLQQMDRHLSELGRELSKPPAQPAASPVVEATRKRAAATSARAKTVASEPIAEKPIVVEPIVAKPEMATPSSMAWGGARRAEPRVPTTPPIQLVPPSPSPSPKSEAPPPRPARDVEGALASRWFVFVGAAAIAIGGLLFIKLAIDSGWFPPAMRCLIGVAFGLLLVAVAEFVRTRSIRIGDTDYVPAALSAGGLVIALGSVFAAHSLYQLIGPTTAFAGLAILALGAIALSLRQGPLIAALGLLGSYAVPTIIPSEHPSAWTFFAYLLAILAASLGVLRQRAWWWLGYLAIAGATVWAIFFTRGFIFAGGDILPAGLFALTMGGLAVFLVSGRAMLDKASGSLRAFATADHHFKIAAIGLAVAMIVVAFLVVKTTYATTALVFLLAAAVLVTALSAVNAGFDLAVPAAGLAVFVTLMAWPNAAFFEMAMDERGLWSSVPGPEQGRFLGWMLTAGAIFSVAGLALIGRTRDPVIWAALASGALLLFGGASWFRVADMLPEHLWALGGGIIAVLLAAFVWSLRGRLAEQSVADAMALLAVTAIIAAAFAFDRLFDRAWLTIALSLLVAAIAMTRQCLALSVLGPSALAVAAVVAIRLFTAHDLWMEQGGLPLGNHWPLYGYGVPAGLLSWSSRIFRSCGDERTSVALEGGALALLIALVSIELRVLIAGGAVRRELGFLEIAAHVCAWLGAAYGLAYRQALFSSFVSIWGARLLFAASMIVLVVGCLLVKNPLAMELPLAGGAVFNALVLAYLVPAILLALIVPKLDGLGWREAKPWLGAFVLFLLFAYLTLETKRLFQGPSLVVEPLSDGEKYAYSAVWLAFALALFVAGIRFLHQPLRYAGLGVTALVVLKVFLWDMSGLGGFYRVASFLGLGLCLVGIGWLYTRFVQPREAPQVAQGAE
jgi:uncharacterized membrane protein